MRVLHALHILQKMHELYVLHTLRASSGQPGLMMPHDFTCNLNCHVLNTPFVTSIHTMCFTCFVYRLSCTTCASFAPCPAWASCTACPAQHVPHVPPALHGLRVPAVLHNMCLICPLSCMGFVYRLSCPTCASCAPCPAWASCTACPAQHVPHVAPVLRSTHFLCATCMSGVVSPPRALALLLSCEPMRGAYVMRGEGVSLMFLARMKGPSVAVAVAVASVAWGGNGGWRILRATTAWRWILPLRQLLATAMMMATATGGRTSCWPLMPLLLRRRVQGPATAGRMGSAPSALRPSTAGPQSSSRRCRCWASWAAV